MPPEPDPRYWPALDGLRGLAVLLVVLGHGGYLPAAAGGLGVAIFFVLSGFLITQVLIRRESGLGHFYASRAVRLLPALLVMLVSVGVVWLIQGRDVSWYGEQAAAALFYVENFFPTRHALQVLNHTWSLSVEEQFYLLWPLVIPLAMKGTARTRFLVMCAVIAAFVVLRLAVHQRGDWIVAYVSLPTNAYGLLLGCLLALVPWPRKWRKPSLITGYSLLLMLVLIVPALPGNVITGMVLVSGAAALLIHGGTLGSRFLESKPLRFAGRISYAWYLWHWPLLWLAGTTFVRFDSLPMIGLSFLIATASTLWIEEPLRARWRARQRERATQPA